ncbi:MAG: hypothetical protein QM487_02790, partial [Candidatus Marithrix sp.]
QPLTYGKIYESNSERDYIIDVVKEYNYISTEENKIIYCCYAEYDNDTGILFFFCGSDFYGGNNFNLFLQSRHVDDHINYNNFYEEKYNLTDISSYKSVKLF